MTTTRYRIIKSFTGPFALVAHPDGTLATMWASDGSLHTDWKEDARLMPDLARRLTDYFRGAVVDFSDVPVPSGSDFFRKCWAACRAIPRGETISYAQLAAVAGASAGAARAAGQAMRTNPMPIITPCHRVIGSSGRLHGFSGSVDVAGGPLAIKQALLDMERTGVVPVIRSRSRSEDTLAGIGAR